MAIKKITTKKRAKKAGRTTRKKSTKKPASKKPVRKKPTKKSAKKPLKRKNSAKKSHKKTAKPKKSSKKRTTKKKIDVKKKIARKKNVTPTRRTTRAPNLLNGPLRGFKPYRTKRGESYMSEGQLEHFTEILSAWKHELMEEVDRTMLHMKDEASNFPDPSDRATQESEFGLELRTRDRERKLLKKINSALLRIEEKVYGYCEETGEEIGLRRLEARPVATLCLEAQERRELAERQFRDREDYYR